jgi:flagellar hook assembly protein FlgD
VKRLSQPVDRFSLLQSADITSLHGVVYVTVKGTQIASWDGTNQVGDPVTNGKYYVKVDNVDSLGVVTSVSQLVMVSRSIARITVNIYNEAGEVVRHLFSYADDPNNNPLSDVQLSTSVIRPSLTGAPNGTVAITSSNGMTLIWDGKSDSGSIVTNGHYQVEVHSVDGTGGEQVITRGVVVRSGNTLITDGNVFAGPNILKEGVTSTLIQVRSSVNYTLTARLYNTAGEVVKQPVTGKTGSNQVTLDVNGMASGLYFVMVDLTNTQGGVAAHQVTQIAIQR